MGESETEPQPRSGFSPSRNLGPDLAHKTAVAEDKASVFEHLMAYPDELCARAADDPLLMGKARLLLERIEAAIPQGLGELARRHAPCLAER